MNDFKKKPLSIDNTLDKIPPQAIDLEEAVLGAILLEKDAIKEVVDILKSESFYKDIHQKIYESVLLLYHSNSAIDILTITEQLRKLSQLDEVGGPFYITQLTSKIASASHIQTHAYIIQQKFVQRQLIQLSQNIKNKAFDESIDIDDLIDFSKDAISRIIENANKRDSIKEAIKKSIVSLDEKITSCEVIFSVKDDNSKMIPVLKKSNISTIIGKAKSRKSFLSTLITAGILARVLYDKLFSSDKMYNIVYFDTEQDRVDVINILRRVFELSGFKNGKIHVSSIGEYDTIERSHIIDGYISEFKPDFVVIDGIRDLILNINDPIESTILKDRILKWAKIYNCHIMCVIHQNKNDLNARGHIGTELVNKSQAVLSVNKVKHSQYSTVECEYMRGLEFESFQFYINDRGLPVIGSEEIKDEIAKETPF